MAFITVERPELRAPKMQMFPLGGIAISAKSSAATAHDEPWVNESMSIVRGKRYKLNSLLSCFCAPSPIFAGINNCANNSRPPRSTVHRPGSEVNTHFCFSRLLNIAGIAVG